MKRLRWKWVGVALVVLAGATALRAAEVRREAVRLETRHGTLHGTLDLPAGKGPFPVVLLIAGSGPTDRDGNSPLLPGKNDHLKLLGQALAERGIAALRYDKRGVGASALAMRNVKPEDVRFDTLAADAAGWVEQLHRDKRFTRVGAVGHSEGSLLGMIAARRARAEAFVSIAGAGRPAADLLREQLGKAGLPEELRRKADAVLDELAAGRPVAEPPQELAAMFHPAVQPYLMSWMKYDPARELARLKVPVLLVQGAADVQVSLEDAKLLAAAKRSARLVVIADMSHLLKQAATPSDQEKAHSDPTAPLAPKLADELATFLIKNLGK